MDDGHPPMDLHYSPLHDSLIGRLLHYASASMEADDFYNTHTRIESAAEIRRRVGELKKELAS
jgi:hypothetical protein